jgi:elongation factor Ts
VRGAARFEANEGEVIAAYVHPPANKIGVLVKAKGVSQEAARRVAMHISSARPRFVSRDDVPAAEVESERAIYAKQPDVEGKPADVQAKIVEGMLQKRFFAENVLAEQAWIFDTGRTVAQALAEEGLEVVAFERYALAE